MLARLGQRDGHALATGTAHATDAVHVLGGGRRHIEVDDVRELVDIEPTGGHVGCHQQVGGARAQATHHPVALLLGHAAMQCLGAVPAAIQGLNQLLYLNARTAEHQRRGGRLGIEQAHQGGGLVGTLHHVRGLPDAWRLARCRGPIFNLHPYRIGEVTLGDRPDTGRHCGREQDGLTPLRNSVEDGADVLGKSHVEHLVGLVEHHHRDVVEHQGAAGHVVACTTRSGHHHIHTALHCLDLPEDGLPAVHRKHPCTQGAAIAMDGL